MSDKISVKDLKKPDKILKLLRSFVGMISGNIKNLLILSALIVVFTSIVVFVNYRQSQSELKASKDLFEVRNSFTADTKNEEKINKLNDLIKTIKDSKAKIQAYFELANVYFADNNFKLASVYFEEVAQKEIGFLSDTALFLKAISLEKAGECKSATEIYKTFIDKNDEVYSPRAMWNTASCSVVLKDIAKANEMYDLINIKYPESDYASLALIAKNKLNKENN